MTPADDLYHQIPARTQGPLSIAERVLRRNDDGREAARHLHTAIGLLSLQARKPSPFLDEAEE